MATRLWVWGCCFVHVCCLLPAFAEDDAACALQAQSTLSDLKLGRNQPERVLVEEADADQEQQAHTFCRVKGKGTIQLTFKQFTHGDVIKADSYKGMKITAAPRKAGCKGPLMILDTRRVDFKSPDTDLKKCNRCALLVYSQDGDTTNVNDCGLKPGPTITFEFDKLHDVVQVVLFDQEEESLITSFNDKGKVIGNPRKGPSGPKEDGTNAIVGIFTRDTKKLQIDLGGSGAVHSIYVCKEEGSVFGDPHVYTMDGEKLDLYENGTYTVFRYSGQEATFVQEGGAQLSTGAAGAASAKTGTVDWQLYAHYGGPQWTVQGLLLVDRSLGRVRQKLELTAEDCQWRSSSGKADWSTLAGAASLLDLEGGEYVTGIEFLNEKHISLRMGTEHGIREAVRLNVVCNAAGINARVSMEENGESKFLQGQIQPGNGQKQQKFQLSQSWASLGGSHAAASFLSKLHGEQYSLVSRCSDEERAKATKSCKKHLGDDVEGDLLEDCVSDVCRGGEVFAVTAAAMMSDD